mgnify:CR=1 FL=1
MIIKTRKILSLSLTAFSVALMALTFASGPAAAHSGRTAADGCHNDRKAGTRHCHGSKKAKTAPRSNVAATKKKPSGSVYYKNCTAARAAGAAPVRRGEPGYASHLDRDNDGIGCE